MAIQWFPGHMAKTKREVIEKLKHIDVVFELVDARIPYASRNPMIDEIAGSKPRLLLLNKADRADPEATKEWRQYFREQGMEALPLDSQSGEGIAGLTPAAQHLMREKQEKMKAKGVNPRAIRAVILGIPNVGKSTLINRLAGKKMTKVGDRPGITKQQTWIKIKDQLQLLDTPGILWPKFEDPITGYRLAATGAIKDDLLDFGDVALFALRVLKDRYPDKLKERYALEVLPDDDVSLFDVIGQKRGCLMKGGEIDDEKTAGVILRDLRSGKIGRVSLEWPADLK